KDFVLVVKEIQTGDETYPDYKMSMFKPETSSLPIYFKEKSVFKNAPLVDGKIESSIQAKIKEFLLDRDHDLEEFSAKKLTEEQQAKITEITNYLTGKASSSFSGSKTESKPTQDDFDFEDNFSASQEKTSVESDEDDFFGDF
ncbi:MAG: hypothetical protein EBU90_23560, partial [Proteobacteria bacterium]|nr:hypothetical protein [Pseudomonadota bacterium]NBP16194.1 hypothetical protein [bacterium]